jgi:hypothetical protein
LNEYGEPVSRTTGYFVSLRDHEAKLPENLDEKSFEAIVSAYVSQAAQSDGVYVGCWYAGHFLYLDLSEWISDKEEALITAREAKQLAIFDCAAGKAIYLDAAGA